MTLRVWHLANELLSGGPRSNAREIAFSVPETYNASRILFDNLDGGNGGTFYAPGATFTINSNVYLFGVWQ